MPDTVLGVVRGAGIAMKKWTEIPALKEGYAQEGSVGRDDQSNSKQVII